MREKRSTYMKDNVSYSKAVVCLTQLIQTKKIDIFLASTVLAFMFEAEKEETIESLTSMLEITKAKGVRKHENN
jgi:hypothetical protein